MFIFPVVTDVNNGGGSVHIASCNGCKKTMDEFTW